MINIAQNVKWGYGFTEQKLSFAYESQRSGTDMQYKLQITVAPFPGGGHYFGFPIYATIRIDGQTVVTKATVKAADPPTWKSPITYTSNWLTAPNKVTGNVSVAFNIFSGLGSERNETYNYSLPVIKAASTITVPDGGTLGTSQKISITRYGNYSVKITASAGAQSTTVSSTGTSVVWTPPLAFAAASPNSNRLAVKFTVQTFDGDTLIGTTYASASYGIPAQLPTISVQLSDTKGLQPTYGYVQGQSVLQVKITASGKYGATIKSYSAAVGSVTASGVTTTFKLQSSGQITVKASATDSRGQTTTSTQTITVVPYAPPIVQITGLYRCNADGAENQEGNHALLQISSSISPLGNKNSKIVTAKHRIKGSGSWTTTAVTQDQAIIPADPKTAYEVQAVCMDKITTSTSKIRVVPIAFVIMQLDPNRRYISIGELLSPSKSNTFSVALNTVLRGKAEAEARPSSANDIVNLAYLRDRIRTGYFSADPLQPKSYRDFEIVFDPPFSKTPRMTATLEVGTVSLNYHWVTVVIYSISKTGATIRVLNASETSDFHPLVDWIAMTEE